MADYVKGLFGGAKSAVSSAVPSDADFADFATAASPVAPDHDASSAFSAASASASPLIDRAHLSSAGRPYTKWYRVWERVTYKDFYQEMVIVPCLLLLILVNLWGTSLNRQRAQKWAAAYFPVLDGEFAYVGFDGKSKSGGEPPMPKEKAKNEFLYYASGRQNVAWVDIKLSLYKRYNPFLWIGELVLSFFFDSMPAPVERVEATAYCFDGKEKTLLPQAEKVGRDSAYDGFVFAIVHKDKMKQLRDDRYDISLTTTKDHQKLPAWATVMSESAEVTEAMLTPELVKAVTEAGETLEALIVSDQPIDAPKKLNDTIPRKRISLSTRLSTPNDASVNLFRAFLRLPDHLVNNAHFRPEALRRIKQTREDEQRKIRKADEDEKSDERRQAADKQKKLERDQKLSRMSDVEQRKFLEKEKADDQKRANKRRTMRS